VQNLKALKFIATFEEVCAVMVLYI